MTPYLTRPLRPLAQVAAEHAATLRRQADAIDHARLDGDTDPRAWIAALDAMHERHVVELDALITLIPDDPRGIPAADCHLERIADAAGEMMRDVEDAYGVVAKAADKTERRLAETEPSAASLDRQNAYPGRF